MSLVRASNGMLVDTDDPAFLRFAQRWRQLQKRLLPKDRVVGRGIARGGRLVPASESAGGPVGGAIPRNSEVAEVDWGLEPIKRRTPSERLNDATARLESEALASYARAGRVDLPHSLVQDMVKVLQRDDPTFNESKLLNLTYERLRIAIREYQARMLERAERENVGNYDHVAHAVPGYVESLAPRMNAGWCLV